jgi:hypothetical protein
MVTALALALLASSSALLALAVRTGIDHPVRVMVGTVMFAVVYLAIGAVVGSLSRNPVNGSVTILFVWILDVFFGPTMGALDRPLTRGLPTHFVSLYMVDLPSRHGGRIGDLGWALTWTTAAALVAFVVVARTVRVAGRRARGPRAGSFRAQVGTAWRTGLRGQCRNPALWALLVVVPSVFVLLAVVVTPDRLISLRVPEGGQNVTREVSMVDVHGGTMAPIAVASLAALIGLFTVLDASSGDRRLVLAGMHRGRLLLVRLGLAGAATAAATVVSLAVTATVFAPEQWAAYIGAVLLIAVAYGLLGMAMAPVFGRVAGVLLAFLLPFLDLGIAQSPMLRGGSASWQQALPGYGGIRVLIDAAVTPGFDAWGPLLAAVSWVAALGLLVTLAIMPAAVARNGLASSLHTTFIASPGEPSHSASSLKADDGATREGGSHDRGQSAVGGPASRGADSATGEPRPHV